MFQAILIALGIGVTAALAAKDKAPPKTDGKAPDKPGETKVKTPEELKAEGRQEVLDEIKAKREKDRELARVVRRAMGNSPRARVVNDGDD